MSHFQQNVVRYPQKQDSMIHRQGKKQSIEITLSVPRFLDLIKTSKQLL